MDGWMDGADLIPTSVHFLMSARCRRVIMTSRDFESLC